MFNLVENLWKLIKWNCLLYFCLITIFTKRDLLSGFRELAAGYKTRLAFEP